MLRALFALTPTESKRLIAKAVAALPEVRKAATEGEIVITHGSTNVRVAEEIMGSCPSRDQFLSGQVINGLLCLTQAEEKPPIIRLVRGRPVAPVPTMEETLQDFGGESVFIKGANAVDPEGNVGIFVAHPAAGTIGFAFGILSARGSRLIVPVGLEKLVPSVREASRRVGQDTLYYSSGTRIGMVPIMNAQVVTELEAFRILFGLEATHIGGGGVAGSEGAVVVAVEGEQEALDRAIELYESIKGEAALAPRKSRCMNCVPTTPSALATPEQQFAGRDFAHCMYQGLREEELPQFLRR